MKLRCRLFGHKWTYSHMKYVAPDGKDYWVYSSHVCTRCWASAKMDLWTKKFLEPTTANRGGVGK
jgi:hypothetical protein